MWTRSSRMHVLTNPNNYEEFFFFKRRHKIRKFFTLPQNNKIPKRATNSQVDFQDWNHLQGVKASDVGRKGKNHDFMVFVLPLSLLWLLWFFTKHMKEDVAKHCAPIGAADLLWRCLMKKAVTWLGILFISLTYWVTIVFLCYDIVSFCGRKVFHKSVQALCMNIWARSCLKAA